MVISNWRTRGTTELPLRISWHKGNSTSAVQFSNSSTSTPNQTRGRSLEKKQKKKPFCGLKGNLITFALLIFNTHTDRDSVFVCVSKRNPEQNFPVLEFNFYY